MLPNSDAEIQIIIKTVNFYLTGVNKKNPAAVFN